MREVDIQAEMVANGKKLPGCWAFKMSNRFLVGVPDLFLQLYGLPTALVEVKYLPKMPRSEIVQFSLSIHQKRCIAGINRAGGCAGWAGVVRLNNRGEYAIAVGRNVGKPGVGMKHDDPLDNQCMWTYKRRGLPWPMREIVAFIDRMDWK